MTPALLLLLALVLALDPDAVRAAMPVVEVIEAPKTFAGCGDSIQVIYSLPGPVDEARLRLCAFASGVSRRLCSEPWPASASASAIDLMPKGLFRSARGTYAGTQSWGNKESHVWVFLGLTPTEALLAMVTGRSCGAAGQDGVDSASFWTTVARAASALPLSSAYPITVAVAVWGRPSGSVGVSRMLPANPPAHYLRLLHILRLSSSWLALSPLLRVSPSILRGISHLSVT